MNQQKLWPVLLVLLYLGFDTEATVVKSTVREPYVTPVCTNDTLNIITLIICNVSTKRNGGHECLLLYQHGQDFRSKCGSRFTLETKSETVFLHLTSLTLDDNGNYTCRCSHTRGADSHLHLNIRVEGDGQSSSSPLKMLSTTTVISNCTAFIVVTGFVLALTLRNKYCRDHARTEQRGLPICAISCSLAKDEADHTYENLQQSPADLCQDVLIQHQHGRKTSSAYNTNKWGMDGRETDPSCEIYVNLN